MGSKIGSIKRAAKQMGISLAEYLEKQQAGLKRCRICKKWKHVSSYGIDRTRGDGLAPLCTFCRNGIDEASPESLLTAVERKSKRLREAWKKRIDSFVPPMKGKKMSTESRKKMSQAAKQRPSNRIGKRHSLETRKKISERLRQSAVRGPANNNYKDGKCEERRGIRFSAAYQRWRFDVYLRDDFACQLCGDRRGGNLNAHHIYLFSKHPELRLNVDNGITLCKTCHDNLHYRSNV